MTRRYLIKTMFLIANVMFQGLPLHVQIDTFEDTKEATPVNRAYCQVKVFCDKVRLP